MEDIRHSETFYSQEFVAARQPGYLSSSSLTISIFVPSPVQTAAELRLQWPVHEPLDIDNWLRRTADGTTTMRQLVSLVFISLLTVEVIRVFKQV